MLCHGIDLFSRQFDCACNYGSFEQIGAARRLDQSYCVVIQSNFEKFPGRRRPFTHQLFRLGTLVMFAQLRKSAIDNVFAVAR